MSQANPQIRAMLSNPDMMRQMMTPENMQAAMGMMGGQGGMPPGMGAGMPGMGGMPPGMGGMPPGGMGGMPGMDPAMMAQMQAMMGGPSSGGANPGATDSQPPREKYATELAQIKEMGFNDEELILQ